MISHTLPSFSPARFLTSHDRDNQLRHRHVQVHDSSQKRLDAPANHQDNRVHPSSQPADSNAGQQAPTQSVNASVQAQALDVAMSRAFNIEIKTKEGDVVTISYNEASTHHQSSFEASDGNGSIKGYQAESTSTSDFQISITGDLNEDEKKSLDDLMKQMRKVGQQFFEGDTKKAFQKALNMGFDTEQIAGFSMSLNMEKSVRAVSAYQQMSEQQPVDNNVLKQAADFYNQTMQSLAGKSGILKLFDNPNKVLDGLSSGIAEVSAGQFQGTSDLTQQTDALKKLLSMAGGLTAAITDAANQNESPA